ncbi:GtrA family protein [Nocardioides sp. MAH-18]|uniref:GtrA family protein n=1 Tax=Nocardioides agri TaxID=2682843 RepID=A0A6L6XNB6_9ACTN|nr:MULTISPECIES: GtrA family protein [unclassified Nocardioides]MBA2953939.1 GtrA family protein [Nocardioides sp. CGMCC 1.13656]MVQ48801.1 GtrA family protein [Nocardioides sp. MAH-18]
MAGRWQRVWTEAYRFLAVGGLATLVAVLLFNFLVHGFHTGWDAPLSGQPYLAFVIANLVGMAVSYRGSRTWVFKDRPPRTADGGRLMFVAINLVTMLIPIAILWISRHVLDLDDPYSDNIAANVIGLFLGMVARFYLFRRLVFRRPVHLADLKQHPMQVFELADLDIDPLDDPVDLSEEPTAPSTSDRAPRPAP